MAFHVACPITCERICYCELGFGAGLQGEKGRREFLGEVGRVEEFLRDPWWVRADDDAAATVQVLVPRIALPTENLVVDDGGGGGDGEESMPATAQAKRAALQRQAAAASLAAEDYVRKLEMGAASDAMGDTVTDLGQEDQVSSVVKVMCRICFSGENEGSERASKMISCKTCTKKYHRSCLKGWAEYRDLFHWSSWACPSCRVCEICRRVGDPNKFMFCKRCDAAYHCYCQQPPHKNVSHGPYLCLKHTRCHSCGSTVHGSGHSTRWFLGYNFCDACGRLFTKEKYCPVCLKVYRDSESTPMVCCDVCQRWVHCECDGISDEKYLQFQADRNLYYKCAACRGDCYQVNDIDDAVQELWRRRDKADRNLIANLRAAAGLPSQEDFFSISPYSDEEEGDPVVFKSEYGRSLKFSVKGFSDKATKNTIEQGKKVHKNSSSKKYVKKKGYQVQLAGKIEDPLDSLEKSDDARSLESSFVDEKANDTMSSRSAGPGVSNTPITRNPEYTKIKFSVDRLGSLNRSASHEVVENNISKATKVETKGGGKSYNSYIKEGAKKDETKNEPVKGPKLVIHLGGRTRKLSGSPRSEASSCHREQEKAFSNGSEESSQLKVNDSDRHMQEARSGSILHDGKGADHDDAGEFTAFNPSRDSTRLISDVYPKASSSRVPEDGQSSATNKTLIFRRRKTEGRAAVGTMSDVGKDSLRNDEILQGKHSKDVPIGLQSESHDSAQGPSVSNSLSKDSRPLLKLKFKNPYLENQSSSALKGEEMSVVKGQRSKRKRPSPLIEKVDTQENDGCENLHQEDAMDEAMDANWILHRLGKNAIGKRVEVHQALDNSWHKGVVSDAIEGTSALSVRLDDGRSRTLELGKQGVRFIPQKQKRTKL